MNLKIKDFTGSPKATISSKAKKLILNIKANTISRMIIFHETLVEYVHEYKYYFQITVACTVYVHKYTK